LELGGALHDAPHGNIPLPVVDKCVQHASERQARVFLRVAKHRAWINDAKRQDAVANRRSMRAALLCMQ
jgi:hypothetical protein